MNLHFLKNWRLGRIGLWVLVGSVALGLLAWLALPPLLKHELELRGSAALGRPLSVGAVTFRPWSLELSIDDIALGEASGKGLQATIKRIHANFSIQSFFRFVPILDGLELNQPQIHVRHLGSGHYDIDDLIALAVEPADPHSKPVSFAISGLVVAGGSMDFVDEPVKETHRLRDLTLTVPAISNLAARADIAVLPHLAFVLNGVGFDSSATARPFSVNKAAQVQFKIKGLDLKPYLPYWPKALPIRAQAGVLDADLTVDFAQQEVAQLKFSGEIAAHEVLLSDTQGQRLLDFSELKAQLADVRPLARHVHLASLDWSGAHFDLARDRQGGLNWLRSQVSQTTLVSDSAQAPPSAWTLQVDRFRLTKAAVNWSDEFVVPTAHAAVDELTLDVSDLQWPARADAHIKGSMRVAGGAGDRSAGHLAFEGQGQFEHASMSLIANDIPVGLVGPYLSARFKPAIQGRLGFVAGLGWRAPDWAVNVHELHLLDLSVREGSTSVASWQQLQARGVRLDSVRRAAEVAEVALSSPRGIVSRDDHGTWMFEHWLLASSALPTEVPRAPQPKSSPSSDSGTWTAVVERFNLNDGQIGFRDAASSRKVAVDLLGIQTQVGPLSWPLRSNAPALALQLEAKVAEVGSTQLPGKVSYRGRVGLLPLKTDGALELVRLPVHPFEPYFGDSLNIEVLRANASFQGPVAFTSGPTGPSLNIKGDALLEDLLINSVLAQAGVEAGPPTSDELLNWKALDLHGVAVSMAPDLATSIEVKETVLSDFFARIVLSETGRLNLQNLVRSQALTPSTAAPQTASATAQLPAKIRIGAISLVNGRVSFADRFVKPNYSTRLSQLTGRMGSFSNDSTQSAAALADLQLRGYAEGTASLEITGRLNPLAKPLALSIQGKVRDLDLPALSPYSVRYTGYGIERGKLSVNVSYDVLPNGQLTASNNIVLNQLSFGDKVDGAPTSLPVKLAVALLADRNGVINIDLPVSGSLNDPEFRIAPIVGRLLLNLLSKAITAPFTLLANAIGGSQVDASTVLFDAGSAVLPQAAHAVLDNIATAMVDRPALSLTVVGGVDLQAERESFRQNWLNRQMAQQRAPSSPPGAPVDVSTLPPAEQSSLLKAVYERTNIPKPRNVLGMTKDLPDSEMRALLLASLAVDDATLERLAARRAQAVRDYLVGKQVPAERLFLGAVKAVSAQADWKPHVDLKLAVR
jgi:uncharacterized protein involved in outer membrane biogenesis